MQVHGLQCRQKGLDLKLSERVYGYKRICESASGLLRFDPLQTRPGCLAYRKTFIMLGDVALLLHLCQRVVDFGFRCLVAKSVYNVVD